MSSGESKISHGVPQGSILGPILFLIYVNDLPLYLSEFATTLFADDNTIGKKVTNHSQIENTFMRMQSKANNWFLANKLCLNENKTIQMVFTLKKTQFDYAISTKFLGINIHCKLQWNEHIKMLATKLSKNVYLLRNLADCLSTNIIKTAYYALIQSHLTYGLLVWGHSSLDELFRIQRRAVRIVANIGYRDECKDQFKNLEILTLPSLYIYRCLKHVVTEISCYSKLNENHNHNTRSCDLLVNYLRLSRCQHSTNYFCIKFFNRLPRSLQCLPPTHLLNKVKTLLICEGFYSVNEYLNFKFE